MEPEEKEESLVAAAAGGLMQGTLLGMAIGCVLYFVLPALGLLLLALLFGTCQWSP